MAATFNESFNDSLWVKSTNIVTSNTYGLQIKQGIIEVVQVVDTVVDINDIVTNPTLLGIRGFVADSNSNSKVDDMLTLKEEAGFTSWFKSISPTCLLIGNITA
tara:strand:+ start:5204 stop:5515 length:312 start_codon:yes stop_codon:yes gene_type:complete